MSHTVRICALASIAVAALPAPAAVVLDQEGATLVSGGYNGPVAQSFRPAEDNITRIDIFVGGTAAFAADVTLSLYSIYNGGTDLQGLLIRRTVQDIPRGSFASFIFDPVTVTPEAEFYMLFELDLLTIGGSRTNPYDRGEVLFGGGNISGGDLAFKTYTDDDFVVPSPASAAVLLLAGVAGRRRRYA